jgi:hypothetical protein
MCHRLFGVKRALWVSIRSSANGDIAFPVWTEGPNGQPPESSQLTRSVAGKSNADTCEWRFLLPVAQKVKDECWRVLH